MQAFLFPIILGFLIGSFGYILVYFWIRPVMKYKRIKRQVANALIPFKGQTHAKKDQTKDRESVRQQAAALTVCYNETLPDWYRLVIERRDEFPLDAAKYLMSLSNTSDPNHIMKQVKKIEGCLGFK